MPITILLVDDHPMFRKGLRLLIEADSISTPLVNSEYQEKAEDDTHKGMVLVQSRAVKN
jgi:DNA-binding NarL/FixJ family response regulator